ncbi:hypothetical protein HUG17_8450 [Dermatophagoides farinae]|uniref:SET and MYND domain-containing protein 4-like n=1 Tax=Dermatophagoides farinae TaxID=6954 RepID=A0A9D4NYX5_DERFA|nr:hypothetical protein HUG17_8450 [Dermatophagoides farinae]
MNSKLRHQIQSRLNDLVVDGNGETKMKMDKMNFTDIEWLINFIEANVTSYGNLWKKIQMHIEKKFHNNSKTLRSCHFDDRKLMARLFFIRAKQLALFSDDGNDEESLKQALINIDFALRFRLSKTYLLAKVYLLAKIGNMEKALQLFSILVRNYPMIENKNQFKRFLRTKSHNYYDDNLHQDLIETFTNDDDKYFSSYDDNIDIDLRCSLTNRHGQGRFFMANETMENDELIFRERPFSIAMFPEASLIRCQQCFRLISNTFYPCLNCTEIVYCSTECLQHSYDSHHRFECRMKQFWTERSKSSYHMFHLLNRFGIKNILKLNSSEKSSSAIIEMYINNNQPMDDDKMYKFQIFMNLIDNHEKHGLDFLAYHLTNALDVAITASIVQGYYCDQSRPPPREQIIHLIDVCIRGIRRISINSFEWPNVGTCVCLIGSLFNHRCESNSEWKFMDNGYFHLTTNRPIAQFEEISINYGCGWPLVSFTQRLKQHSCYFFQCNCCQCMEDSKTILALQCRQCTIGPVLLSSIVYNPNDQDCDAICMLCYRPYPNTKQVFDRLCYVRNEISLVMVIFPCLTSKMRSTYLMKIQSYMDELIAIMYDKSRLLMDDLQKSCQILLEYGDGSLMINSKLIKYAQIIDKILPRYDQELVKIKSLDSLWKSMRNLDGITRYLLRKNKIDDEDNNNDDDQKNNNHDDEEVDDYWPSLDDEIRYMSFWTNFFRNYIHHQNQNPNHDPPQYSMITMMELCENFHNRLFGLLKFRIRLLLSSSGGHNDDGEKQHQQQKQPQSSSMKEAIELLSILLKSKQDQWNLLQKKMNPSLLPSLPRIEN